ncbi:hypothetical protein FA13DRAFT_1392219 [Coprinellus micaceus]|uniref:Uncharacterized protein n=1 Tax=Coprinellus micaceus TaxID=71717 RepID=A0A4Y7SQJ4_COPMI|nr:hypothetical protein FA13DRAFT_1392219 [Coprinellus micaceus]
MVTVAGWMNVVGPNKAIQRSEAERDWNREVERMSLGDESVTRRRERIKILGDPHRPSNDPCLLPSSSSEPHSPVYTRHPLARPNGSKTCLSQFDGGVSTNGPGSATDFVGSWTGTSHPTLCRSIAHPPQSEITAGSPHV